LEIKVSLAYLNLERVKHRKRYQEMIQKKEVSMQKMQFSNLLQKKHLEIQVQILEPPQRRVKGSKAQRTWLLM